MITRLLLTFVVLAGASASACAGRSASEEEPAASESVGSELAGSASVESPPAEADPALTAYDSFHPAADADSVLTSYDFHPDPTKYDQAEFDLVSTSHSAMVLVVECQPRIGEPDHCKKKFDPERNAPIDLPIRPHCGSGSPFDCSIVGSSFAKHDDDYYFPLGYAKMTGSFIAKDEIITAAHSIDAGDLDRVFFVMNFVQRDHHWPTIDLDGDGSPDHARIDPRFVLAVDDVVDCELRQASPPDWAVFRVRPLLVDQAEIPEHAHFELARSNPGVKAKIRVLAHPRLLPLKLADGIITASVEAPGGMTAIFDVAQGSSGSPVLLAKQDVIVGINRVRSRRWMNQDGYYERRCTLDAVNGCFHQPLTPATRIRSILANTHQTRLQCHLKADEPQ
jgi:hypothetical protein